jgi:hypothetical protein
MIAAILTTGGFLVLCSQFLYEVFQTHLLFKNQQTQDQALAVYIFGGILLMAGLFLLM